MGGGPHRKHSVVCGSTWARSSSSVILPSGERNDQSISDGKIAGRDSSIGAPLTGEERRENRVDGLALLRDVEITGHLVGEFLTRLHDGALGTQHGSCSPAARGNTRQLPAGDRGSDLKEKLLGALGAVVEVNGADAGAPPPGGAAQTHEVSGVKQDGVEGVDSHASSHQEQIDGGVGGRRVVEEVPAHAHGYLGAHGALRKHRNTETR